MRPRASFADESHRIERGAYVPKREVIVPVDGMIMPFVVRIAE
jgi:hypothetical protein